MSAKSLPTFVAALVAVLVLTAPRCSWAVDAKPVAAILEAHCFECHGNGAKRAIWPSMN